jgi:hypothetical protein
MSDPITFPIKAYSAIGANIKMRTFQAYESGDLSLHGTILKYRRAGLFGDYGNEPDYYCTDLNAVKNKALAELAVDYAKKVIEIKSFYA